MSLLAFAARALLLAALPALAAAAEPFDLARLMRSLAAAPAGKVEFHEQKHSSLLATPVESRGTLSYQKPGVVEKDVVAPRAERYRIDGDQLSVTRGGKTRSIPLASQPILGAFAASLRGVLAGDEKLLREHFRIALSGNEADWRLELTPIEEEVARLVAAVAVSGRAARVATIEVREAGGDRSVLQVK